MSPIKINSEILTECKKTTFLGVKLQQQLLWHSHINFIRAKIDKQCGVMHVIRDYLEQRSLMLIYYALIYPSISYCLTIWVGASSEALKFLVTIQQRTVIIICGLRASPRSYRQYFQIIKDY